jgi:maleylpyruvate isomerase
MTPASTGQLRPRDDLLLAFRGTSYFLRAVSVLSDAEFDEPGNSQSLMNRREVMATVAYDARGLAHLVEQIRTGVQPAITFENAIERADTISFGAALPPRALRHLIEHSAVHLRVEWRDLLDALWAAEGRDHNGESLPVAETPWLRARQVWLGAIDLGSGARFDDLPIKLLERFASERLAEAERDGYSVELRTTDNGVLVRWGDDTATGRLADIVRWLFGRDDGVPMALSIRRSTQEQ